MENNTTKTELMKPVLLKAGIPLAITVAGFVFARLIRSKHPTLETSSIIRSDHVNSTEIVDSHEEEEEEEEDINHFAMDPSLQNSDVKIDKYEIESSRIQVQELEERTLELGTRYGNYLEMKEQEVMLLELHNKLSMEIARIELLEREISALEAIGIGYLKIVKVLANSGSENGLQRKRVKKLLKKIKQQSHVIKEQSLQIEAKEAEILRNIEQLESGADVGRKMEVEMKLIAAQLQIENNELLNQIELANKTISSKTEEEEAIKAGYDRVVSEMEQLEKERAVEAKELIYLRWCNACLRHELLRRNQEQQVGVDDQMLRLNYGDIRSDDEIGYSRSEHDHHPHHKKAKIIQKLKRWIDGHEKSKSEK